MRLPGLGILGATLDTLWDEASILTERVLDRHLRVAVTGLRRSGKTVFITSAAHHLADAHDLPFLQAAHDGRYLGARLVSPERPGAFPYARFRDALAASPPAWPSATERLTTLRLELAYRTRSLVLSRVSPVQVLTLDIIDYPGEWLLDLPLLETSYEEFSAAALALAGRPLRAEAAKPWLERLATFAPDGPEDSAAIAELAAAYTAYLKRCHAELGLSMVQPGRFTNPGDLAGSELLVFCPLPPGPASAGTNRARMAERFARYRDEVVRGFYDDHFSRFDRQVVLVDLLSSLNAGPGHFADTQDALEVILRSFRYGETGLFGRLFAPRIDRVLFAASKADHVAANQHANLKGLLELMVAPAARAARFSGVRVEVLALAALRSTDVVRTEHQGQILSCVRGRLRDEGRETVLFPGELPESLPEPEDWASGRFRFRDFAPRRLSTGERGQHIRLDQALEYLIGDKLA
ncbi:MAG TPA: YcjX family protein [Geminicoccaceae bacterium]